MNFKTIAAIYDRLPTEMQTIFLILMAFGIYKGMIKIPWIPIGNKCAGAIKKIWLIKTVEQLYEQMNVFEVSNASILFTLKKVYFDLTKNESHNQHYELITKEAEKECKGNIRKWMKENHLTSYTDTEWRVYKKTKIDLLLEIVTYHFDLKYKDCYFDISRDILHSKNAESVIPLAVEKWNKAFDDCRTISKYNEEKIKKLEKGTL